MQAEVDVIWGCQPNKQLEVQWVNELLKSARLHHIDGHQQLQSSELNHTHHRILVESGLMLLESRVNEERKLVLHEQRLQRLKVLHDGPSFLLIHLSDEEGLDGDSLYNILPRSTKIWRNFPYDRFDQMARIKSFPIGPRREFLESLPTTPSATRKWPWTFMGTLWRTGNRILATSIFLHEHPKGDFFGGQSFGSGIPIEAYRARMMESVFALCPEGDRHFDTFRLYESLEAGCIPLVVERQGQALRLLGEHFPAPIFKTWKEASQFVRTTIGNKDALNQLQFELLNWWSATKTTISQDILEDLISPHELNRYDFDTACGA